MNDIEREQATWRSVEVEAGNAEAVERWLELEEASPLELARAKRAVRALLAENARLRSVLGHCPRGIAVLDEAGNVTGYNRELCELLGVHPSLGEPIEQHFAPTDGELLHAVVSRAGTTRKAAAVLRTAGTDEREIEFLAATLPSQGERSIGVVLAGEDRTAALDDERERKTIAEANRRSAYAMGGVALHRDVEAFRARALEALERAREDHRSFELARTALEELGDVLARNAGRERLSATPGLRADVAAVARRIARLSWIGSPRRASAMHVEIDGPLFVRISESELAQVLANVVDNAIHAVDDAQRFGVVSIAAERRRDRGGVEIVVKDDGVGIDPSRLQRCFEAYETTRAEEGAKGLGLAIARALVDSVGGTIRVLSEKGRGTTVVIELPEA